MILTDRTRAILAVSVAVMCASIGAAWRYSHRAKPAPKIETQGAPGDQMIRMELMLIPDQQAEYDKKLQELRDRQKQQRSNRGSRPGGPGF